MRLREFLGYLVFFFGLTPWVSFGTNNLDTQPWTLLACFAYLGTARTIKVTRPVNSIVLLIFTGLAFALISQPLVETFLFARGVFSYLTFALTMVVVHDFILRYGIPLRNIVFVNLLYISFAVLDLVAPGISGLISASRTTIGRGVSSLAAEPSFLAVILFFLSWIILVARDYRTNIWVGMLLVANVFVIVVLARSALGLLLLATAGAITGLYAMSKLRVSYLITLAVLVVILGVVGPILAPLLAGSRLQGILNLLHNQSVLEFAMGDASTNSRLQSIFFPILGAGSNFFVPGGFESYSESLKALRQQFADIVIVRGEGNIISSWTGAMMFELGIFGVAVLAVVAFANTHFSLFRLLERALLLAVCVHAIPINFPPIAILIVLFFGRWR